MKNLKFRWWYLIIIIPLILGMGFLIWASTPLGPMQEALDALESSEHVDVTLDPWYIFAPTGGIPETGIIIYPGGRVDPRSYAPAAHTLAEEGYLVVIVPMPLNLAVFGVDKAEDVMAAFPLIENWIIGGHSLGGSMAANFTINNPEFVDGLFFWGSYPGGSDDFSGEELAVISISASLDGLATQQDIADSVLRLPEDYMWIVIEGGNHAQFGWYGEQRGDNEPAISREQQQADIIKAMLKYLINLE